jgi:hypothetical protein
MGSWHPAPHQEFCLAALDQRSSDAMSRLAALGDAQLAAAASIECRQIRARLEALISIRRAFLWASPECRWHARPDGDDLPAVAWWSGAGAGEAGRHARGGRRTSFDRLGYARHHPGFVHDPISHRRDRGWPLFTAGFRWPSTAPETAFGYAHLILRAPLTWAQDSGAVTRLLSGEFSSLWDGASTRSGLQRWCFRRHSGSVRPGRTRRGVPSTCIPHLRPVGTGAAG